MLNISEFSLTKDGAEREDGEVSVGPTATAGGAVTGAAVARHT